MTQPNNMPPRAVTANDEIDLLDLVSTLWQRKFLIILVAVLGFAAAYGLSLLMPEKWRSTAMVVAPRIANTEELLEKNRAVARIINSSNQEFKDIDVTKVLDRVFETFLYSAADSDEKQEYLKGSELFKRKLAEGESTELALLDEMSRSLSVELPDEKKKALSMAYALSFTSEDAESAQSTLSGYIDNINSVAVEASRTEFRNTLEAQIALRQQQLADIDRDVKSTRKVEIATYADALKTAQKAGIKSAPSGMVGRGDAANNLVLEINANPQQLYLQGEEVLQALLDVAQNEPVIYPKTYYRLQYEIEALENLRETTPKFDTFTYQIRPTLPTQRISPKRAQLAVLGGVVGGVLASLYVLIAGAFANRRRTAAGL